MSQTYATEIKEQVSIIEFYRFEGNEITTSGKNPWKKAGLCPFHQDQKTGSFYVHSESGAFKCFSCDTKGGDVIAFLMKKYDMNFKQAVQTLKNGGYYAK